MSDIVKVIAVKSPHKINIINIIDEPSIIKHNISKITLDLVKQDLQSIKVIKSNLSVTINHNSVTTIKISADLSNNVELNEPSDEEEAEGQDDDYVLKNKFNISAAFRQYKSQREKKAKQEGFYVDGNLHQILSLHHVLLLKENKNPESLMESFGLNNLNTLLQILRNKYTDMNVLRGLCPMTKRRITKQLINGIANNADDEDDMMNVLRISLQHTRIDCFI
ncbi:hypothetical protein EDC94DRAFT_657514 [Helicostylum pulchrum]|nr:hypothetical protein EDC94DRAFT_657514 [Helicostylum pulchrum]